MRTDTKRIISDARSNGESLGARATILLCMSLLFHCPTIRTLAETPGSGTVPPTAGVQSTDGSQSSRRTRPSANTANRESGKRISRKPEAASSTAANSGVSPSPKTTDKIRITRDDSSSRRAQNTQDGPATKIASKSKELGASPSLGANSAANSGNEKHALTSPPSPSASDATVPAAPVLSAKPADTWVLKIDAPKKSDVETTFEPIQPTPAERQASSVPTPAHRNSPFLIPEPAKIVLRDDESKSEAEPLTSPPTADDASRSTEAAIQLKLSDDRSSSHLPPTKLQQSETNVKAIPRTSNSEANEQAGTSLHLLDSERPTDSSSNPATQSEQATKPDRVAKAAPGKLPAKPIYLDGSPAAGVLGPLTHDDRGRLVRREFNRRASKAMDREAIQIMLRLSRLEKLTPNGESHKDQTDSSERSSLNVNDN